MTAELVPVDPPSHDQRIDEETAKFLKARKSDHTRDAYRLDLASWWTWCAGAGLHPLDASPGDILNWLADLPEAGTTKARRVSAVSSWYRWLIREQAAERNPVQLERTERPVRSPRHAPALSPAQAEVLLAAADADSPRAAAIVYLLTYTGIRVGELIAADTSDVGMTGGEMVLYVRGKGGKGRTVRLNSVVVARLDRYGASRLGREYLPATAEHAGTGRDRPLIATSRGKRVGRKEVRRLLQRLAKQAGLPEQVAARMTPHATRATYATSSFANKLDGRAIQETMGHVSFDTTVGYDRSKVTAARDPAIRLAEIIRPPVSDGE